MSGDQSTRARWGRFRFSVIGPLLASPPEHGDLGAALAQLAARAYKHPTTGESVRFGVKTLERWYYLARNHPTDPVGALARKTHPRAGTQPSISVLLAEVIRARSRSDVRTPTFGRPNVGLALEEPQATAARSRASLS